MIPDFNIFDFFFYQTMARGSYIPQLRGVGHCFLVGDGLRASMEGPGWPDSQEDE